MLLPLKKFHLAGQKKIFSSLHLSREILRKQSSYSWISLGWTFMAFMVN